MSEQPTVVAIHLAPAKRAPTVAVPEVVAQAGVGLVGDRYHGTRHRHVSVQSLTDLGAAAAELGYPVEPGSTRRTITLSHGPVPTQPGEQVRIGEVELEVVRIAAPCLRMEDSVGPGARRALHARGGSVFRLLSSGTIRLGDVLSAPSR